MVQYELLTLQEPDGGRRGAGQDGRKGKEAGLVSPRRAPQMQIHKEGGDGEGGKEEIQGKKKIRVLRGSWKIQKVVDGVGFKVRSTTKKMLKVKYVVFKNNFK